MNCLCKCIFYKRGKTHFYNINMHFFDGVVYTKPTKLWLKVVSLSRQCQHERPADKRVIRSSWFIRWFGKTFTYLQSSVPLQTKQGSFGFSRPVWQIYIWYHDVSRIPVQRSAIYSTSTCAAFRSSVYYNINYPQYALTSEAGIEILFSPYTNFLRTCRDRWGLLDQVKMVTLTYRELVG